MPDRSRGRSQTKGGTLVLQVGGWINCSKTRQSALDGGKVKNGGRLFRRPKLTLSCSAEGKKGRRSFKIRIRNSELFCKNGNPTGNFTAVAV
jgi:hypothetical protein